MLNPLFFSLLSFLLKYIQVDGSDKKGKKGFQVGKRKVKTKLTAVAKAKAAQAMELDK